MPLRYAAGLYAAAPLLHSIAHHSTYALRDSATLCLCLALRNSAFAPLGQAELGHTVPLPHVTELRYALAVHRWAVLCLCSALPGYA